MTIKDYKLIQADGNMALAAEVMRFVREGWEPLGRPFMLERVVHFDDDGRELQGPFYFYAQAIILSEPEHAELARLRDIERHVDRIVTELDNPIADELGMVTFAHEELTKVLRGGQFERKR